MKSYFTLIAIIILCGCKSRYLVGNYADKEKHFYLALKEDSTFTYHYSFDRFAANSKGKWTKISDNQCILVSEPFTNEVPLKITEIENHENVNYVTFNMPYSDKSKFEFDAYINGILYQKLTGNELNSIKINSPINSLWLIIYRNFDYWMNIPGRVPLNTYLNTVHVKISQNYKNENENVEILLRDSLFYLYPFDHSIATVKRKTLYFKNIKNIAHMKRF